MAGRHDPPNRHAPTCKRISLAIVSLIGWCISPGMSAAQLSTTGRWTTIPNDVAGQSFDIVSDLRGRGTHMALLRGANDTTWVIHWHLGEKARLWSAVPGRDTSPAFDVPLPVDTSQLFCAGHSLLADGRLLVVGGTLNVGNDNIGTTGTNRTVAFNPITRQWSVMDTMSHERWYPTSTTLGDGRVLATSGSTFFYQSVFGGRQANALRGDVRLISGARHPAWENDVTAGTAPGSREGHTMVMTENFSFAWGGRTGPNHGDTASTASIYFLDSFDSDTRQGVAMEPGADAAGPRAWTSGGARGRGASR